MMFVEENRQRLLGELVRNAERFMGHKVRIGHKMGERIQRMVPVGLSGIAGALSIILFVAQDPMVGAGPAAATILGLGIALNLAFIVVLLVGFGGSLGWIELITGPHPASLAAKAADPNTLLEGFSHDLLYSYASFAPHNDRRLHDAETKRRRALTLLLLAGGHYVVATVLISARVVL